MSEAEQTPQQPRLAPNQPSNQQEIDSRSVYLGNVDYSALPGDLKELLDDCGVINRITILYDKHTGKPRGYAFVEFETHEGAQKAVAMNGTEFRGRILTVTPKRTNYPGITNARRYSGAPPQRGRGRGGRATAWRGRTHHLREDDAKNEEPPETSPE
ncbi:hypothetical protein KL919_001863 [Ogataea angusta]|nr:hypothetical protein KL943_002179 [Ogataea angusta]KAG7861129.1 hypothetical protein KL919_001863 [Ogataea angusta]